VTWPDHIENAGKWALDETGKHPVNENDEKFSQARASTAQWNLKLSVHIIPERRKASPES
jgi:hypothetical protein